MTRPIRISMIYLYLYLYLYTNEVKFAEALLRMVFYPVDSVIRLLYVTWVRWSQWVLKIVTAPWAINNLWQLAFIEICKWFLQLIAKELCLGCKYNWVSVRDLGEAKSALKLQIFKKFVYITAGANSKYLITYQGSSCKHIGKAKWGSGAVKRCSKISQFCPQLFRIRVRTQLASACKYCAHFLMKMNRL